MEGWIIDRFEGEFALCENEEGRIVPLPLSELPADAAEGDCLVCCDNGSYAVDHAATEARRRRLRARTEALLARSREELPDE